LGPLLSPYGVPLLRKGKERKGLRKRNRVPFTLFPFEHLWCPQGSKKDFMKLASLDVDFLFLFVFLKHPVTPLRKGVSKRTPFLTFFLLNNLSCGPQKKKGYFPLGKEP